MSESVLLREFAATRSEVAFAALVRQHVNLVFATALRQVGDRSLAEEISQDVFAALARKAGALGSFTTIAGWLYKATLLECRRRLRSELRRQRREEVAAAPQMVAPEPESDLKSLVPLLDEALLDLRESDRLAVMLRFLEEKPCAK
ncbi:MAG: sigma-70 family RNA polymerase sigma factor [Verrucomicrobiales bacterium]|nr:sigma-70 family RNA polymerase sigma factor [Verrucomicrobiales bacterium]